MSTEPTELDADIVAYLMHDLDPTRQEAFDLRLRSDAVAAVRFAQLCRNELVLATVLGLQPVVRRSRPLPRRLTVPRAGWWWTAAAILVGVIGSMVALRSAWNPTHPDLPLVAMITESSGTSSLRADGVVSGVAAGTPLHAGVRLEIGADARLAFAYPDGSRVELEPSSRIELQADPGRLLVVERGSLRASIMHQPEGRPLRVVTPQGEAVVVGTRFSVDVASGATRLTVSEGLVRLRRAADGASCLVKAGFVCVAAGGGKPLELQWVERLAERLPPGAKITMPSELSAWEGERSPPPGFEGLDALGSHAPQPGTRFMGEIRSPVFSDGPVSGADRYLAVRYLAAGFRPGDQLKFMLKDARGAIYHGVITPTIDAWSDAIVRLDGAFLDLGKSATRMSNGTQISQIVLIPIAPDGQEGVSGPRLWVSEVIGFTAAGAVAVQPVGRP